MQPARYLLARILGWLQAALLLSCSGNAVAQSNQPAPTEFEVKAAYLFHFAKFVEWPPPAFENPAAPIVFGILGDDPFGPDLDAMLAGKTVNNRPVVIKRFKADRMPEFCHVLFIAKSEKRRVDKILEATKGAPILTVGDELDRFGRMGGMINFTIKAKKVRFEINNQAAVEAGLKISSKLLKLAREADNAE